MLFADYMNVWLAAKYDEVQKGSLTLNTYAGYASNLKVICPYFRAKGITLINITYEDIEAFYDEQYERVSANTVKRYHICIHSALKYAFSRDKQFKDKLKNKANPALQVELRPIPKYEAKVLNQESTKALMELTKELYPELELAILIAIVYGCRRSEFAGLKWSNIDFDSDTIFVRHTVITCNHGGKRMIVFKDKTKTKSSYRIYPLLPLIKEKLMALRNKQAHFRDLCGNCYNKEYADYLFVNEMGDFMSPDKITRDFKAFTKKHELEYVRYHGLRHTCASLMLTNDISMTEVMEWLGHSDISTTVNTYGHFDFATKKKSAAKYSGVLGV
jgi:integrase